MSEKTEPPTPKRIRDAREKGQFLFSKEIVSGALLLSITGILYTLYPIILADVLGLFDTLFDDLSQNPLKSLPRIMSQIAFFFFHAVGGVCAVVVLVGIVTNVAQTGPVFSGAKLSKGLQSINFVSNAKQLFSKRNLFNFGLSIFKIFVISFIAYLILRGFINQFIGAVSCGFPCMLWVAGRALLSLFLLLGALYVPIALIDFIAQRHFYLKELRMSKEELKQEYKEMEGNPEIKAQRRQAHQELLDNSMLNSVRKSSVIVKNPTHYAVALLYDEEKTPLPLVVGKGEGAMAQAILKIAEEENIPVYENVDLAQDLFHDIDLGHYITSTFIVPVAEALRAIESLKQQGGS